jgi:glutathione S-transferase
MFLIGQFDSPFVRRVAIALELYEIAYRHEPWSTWGDAEQIARYNPLRRVPTLVLDDGECLLDSHAILDALDEMRGRERALIPQAGPLRRAHLRVCALATGMADKAVSLFYERLLHPETSTRWVERCRAQIGGVLEVLERERAARLSEHWFGPELSHADIAVACALRFTQEAHPNAFDLGQFPGLAAHAARCEALPVFGKIAQPFFVQT